MSLSETSKIVTLELLLKIGFKMFKNYLHKYKLKCVHHTIISIQGMGIQLKTLSMLKNVWYKEDEKKSFVSKQRYGLMLKSINLRVYDMGFSL